ncbi:uncharacterized protein LOC135834500 isoform X24 [Planococcus citri]|uniref:uncharacterized protein LOC135834500 isoform X24 n=1 Tax=Planococcus citri TaxID=170843 RepID=UPI0031F83E43
MTETVSNVYDLIFPSPASLREISCNALVTGLWRWGVENRVSDDFISRYRLDTHNTLDPNIPSTVKRIIDECANNFICMKEEWVDHLEELFFGRNISIFLDFSDFIIDRDGLIHYVRTAKQMMKCDRLSIDEKFKIACIYCFEDDIKRIWPSVSERLDLNEIEFEESPELFYWICMLRNEPDRIPNPDDVPIDVLMLRACPYRHWSFAKYFWNRIRPESRLSETIYLSSWNRGSFARFILPKLSDKVLGRVVLESGVNLMYDLVRYPKFYALPTWMYIRNKMNESKFARLIELFVVSERDYDASEDATYSCYEIWRNSPDEWKRSAIRNILNHDRLLVRDSTLQLTEYRGIRFLLILLSDASFEDRNNFWKKNWRNLIVDTRGKDLHRIMKLCFKDENDIAKFMETNMFNYESISARCIRALTLGDFEQLNDVLIFCCPDAEKRMELKQRLLRSCISDPSFDLSYDDFSEFELLNEFINDAFANAEVAADFKNCIISFCTFDCVLLHQCIRLTREYSSDDLIHFIDTFVSNEGVINISKQRILEHVRNWLLDDRYILWKTSADDLQKILVWCLGNEEEVSTFKKSVLPMSVFFADDYIWKVFTPLEIKMNDENVGGFLKWYFRNPEEIDEFNRLFADRL